MNLQNLVDLSPILAILAALAGSGYSTSGLLTWMRRAALNAWFSGLSDEQRAALYQGILLVMNYLIIGGLALATHYTLSWNLAGSVLVAALFSTVGAHGLYNYNQKQPAPAPVSVSYASPFTAAAMPNAPAQPDPFAPIVLPDTDATPAPAADTPATPASA